MEYRLFHEFFSDIALKETRGIFIKNENRLVPDGDYGFCEMFCNDPKCDCRRVVFRVSDEQFNLFAMVGFGWENEEYYEKWFNVNVTFEYNKYVFRR